MPAFRPAPTSTHSPVLPWSQRLATRQARSVLLYAFLIGLLLSLTQILLDYRNQASTLENTLEQLIESVQKNAEAAIWDLDESLAMAVVEGLLGYEPITEAQLHSSDSLVAQQRQSQVAPERPLLRALFGQPYTRQVALYPPDSQSPASIGHILLSVDPTYSGEAFLKRSLWVLVSGVARTVLLSCVLLVLFYFTLTRPVLAVSNAVRQYRPNQDEPRTRLDTQRQRIHGELAILYQDTEQLMASVDQFGTTLEQQVQERTEKLTLAHQSLDSISACIMSIDRDFKIVYANRATHQLFKAHAACFRRPEFEPTELLGQSLAALQANDLASLCQSLQSDETHTYEVALGLRHFQIAIAPLQTSDSQSGGYTLEWIDKTDEHQIESALEKAVSMACSGDLSTRLPESGQSPFFDRLSQQINQMLYVNETVFGELEKALYSLSKGELQQTIDSSYGGTFTHLHEHFNQTIEQVSHVIFQIKKTVSIVSHSCSQLTLDHQNLRQYNNHIDTHLQQSHTRMQTLSQSVEHHSHHVLKASTLSAQSQSKAQQGHQTAQAAKHSIEQLAELSDKISTITDSINEIAFQTNLLALNAAVEAARAGGQGKGFAVVASEVQSLSLRSSEAAGEIQQLSTKSSASVSSCMQMIDNAQHTLDELHQCANQVTDVMQQVNSSSQDQLSQIQDTAEALDLLYQAGQEMSQLLLRTIAASEAMRTQSIEADKLTEFFSERAQNHP